MNGLSLIVPAHNSEKVLERSLKEYFKIFSKKFTNLEIIVVCNGCIDESAKISKSLEKDLPIKTITIPQRGKGYALISGFKEAQYDLIGFLDSDNPFDLKKISNSLDILGNEKIDMVIITKYLRGKKKKQEVFLRRLLSLGGAIFTRTIFSFNFRDTQAGAKFFKKKAWVKIKNQNFICNGFDIDIELLYKIKKSGFKIAEVYVPLEPEEFSTVRLKYLPGMVFRLIKLRLL